MAHDLGRLCRQFFEVGEVFDADAMRAMIHADGKFFVNGELQGPLSMLPQRVEVAEKTLGAPRYVNVRQVIGDDAVAEQHTVQLTRPNGDRIDFDVCCVLQFDENGKVTRLDEYLDRSSLGNDHQ